MAGKYKYIEFTCKEKDKPVCVENCAICAYAVAEGARFRENVVAKGGKPEVIAVPDYINGMMSSWAKIQRDGNNYSLHLEVRRGAVRFDQIPEIEK
jgi:hypothetical protein